MKPPRSAIARLMDGPMIKTKPVAKPSTSSSRFTFVLVDGLTAKQKAWRRYYARNRENLLAKHRSPTRRVITWQTVQEGLPDDELMVLVATSEGEVWPAFRDGQQWLNADASTMSDQVTHWCDLPDPPACSSPDNDRGELGTTFRCELPGELRA